MNALLVVTPQPAYLDEAKKWIERLDKGGDGSGVRFYVYQVQNSRAERIGPLLQQAFTGRVTAAGADTGPPTLAPGTPAGTIVSPPAFQAQPATVHAAPGAGPACSSSRSRAAGARLPAQAQRSTLGQRDGIGVVRNIQVVADKDNNTILIVATPSEYSVIEAALKKLDVPQRQVVIEVTIAEVTLTDELDFGVDWLFKGGAPSGRGSRRQLQRHHRAVQSGVPTRGGNAARRPTLALAQGFNYLINNANFPGGVQAALHLLDTYGNTKVISNPHLVRARQPEGDDQGRQPDSDQPADLRGAGPSERRPMR